MRLFSIFLFIFPVWGYSQNSSTSASYPNTVGDIEFDSKLDNKDFVVCGEKFKNSIQYSGEGLEYEGEKIAIEKDFKNKYISFTKSKESGLIRIRFIVNCEGKTDRFRVLGMDENYNEKTFSPKITNQLLQITKDLKGWKIKRYKANAVSYYQYLIFKIVNGRIIEILP
jgi:hypothetical protein